MVFCFPCLQIKTVERVLCHFRSSVSAEPAGLASCRYKKQTEGQQDELKLVHCRKQTRCSHISTLFHLQQQQQQRDAAESSSYTCCTVTPAVAEERDDGEISLASS